MTLNEAIQKCHVRSAVYRTSNPKIKYWMNHPQSIESRVPEKDKYAKDWEEYDPRDYDTCSLFMFND